MEKVWGEDGRASGRIVSEGWKVGENDEVVKESDGKGTCSGVVVCYVL